MLLSMVGEVNRYAHEGAEVAIALLSEPAYSVVLRTASITASATFGYSASPDNVTMALQ
jgi:hypothetical protein